MLKWQDLLVVGIIALAAGFAVFFLVPGKTVYQQGSAASLSQSNPLALESTFAKIMRTGKADVCYIVYPPAFVKDPKTGQVSGHVFDSFDYAAKDAKITLEYHETTWSNWVSALQTGECDISIAPTFATTARATAVSFTAPIFYAGNSAVVRKGDTRFKTLDDLNYPNVTIAVAEGEASQAYAQTHFPKAKLEVLSTAVGGDLSLPLLEVSTGRADVGLSDSYIVSQYAASHPEVVDLFASNPYGITAVGWAVRPEDTELLNFLNTVVAQLDSSGKLVEFEKKYGAHWLHPKVAWSAS